MRFLLGEKFIELVQGDITNQHADAIVNAANSRLAGGGGVDGAIHRHGGPSIMEETIKRYPDGCATGDAVITSAGDLDARFIIHAVGPHWNGGRSGEAEQLESAYRRSLILAMEAECSSVAMPSLSTGAYRFPIDKAARIALRTTKSYMENADHPYPQHVYFVLFDAGAYGAFAAALSELKKQ